MKKQIITFLNLFVFLILIGSNSFAQIGTWTAVTNKAPNNCNGVMLLLTDGTVICKDDAGTGQGTGWNKLTPDIHGSYSNGTWTSIASMNYDRLFFASQVLPNGKVFAAGGEYGAGATRGEVYDPVANTWTNTNTVVGSQNIYDGNSQLLYNGIILVGLQNGNNPSFDDQFYTNSTNSWTTAPLALLNHDEAAWLKLPDSSILYIGIASQNSCRYIPQTNTFVADGNVPVAVYDPYGSEMGGAYMLPNGKSIFFGATAHNAIYTPSGNINNPGTWTAAADFPMISGTQVGQTDAAGCMMVNGHILLAVSPVNTSSTNQFLPPIYFVEYDYTTNTFAQVTSTIPTIGTDEIAGVPCNFSNMLELPNGQVLFGESEEGVNQYWVYTPGSAAIAAGKPTINSILPDGCPNYKLTGKLFNGISEGAGFGDDWQNSTNYPIIRMTDGTNVYYAKTTFWNRVGALRTDSLEDTVQFMFPMAIPAGTYSLVVTANGFASNPILFKTLGITIASHTNASCAVGGTATANAATGGLTPYTYSWSPSGGTNLTATGLSGGTYTITVTDNNGCTATASVTITQPMLTISIASHTGANCTSSGSATSNPATGGTAPYTYDWSPSGGTNLTASGLSAGTYTITATDKNGCQGFASVTITQPTLNITIASQTNSNCNGSGSATANAATGGTAPYTYDWSPSGGTNLTATGLSVGTYTITATDHNGCTGSTSVTISNAPAYTILFSQNFEGTATIYKNNVVLTGGSPATVPVSQTWGSANTNDGNNTLHRDDALGTWSSNDDICGQAYQPIPTCAANGSTYSALFDNWDANSFTTGNIISPAINLTSGTCATKFSFYYFNGDCRGGGQQATLALQFNNGSGYVTVWSDLVGCTTSWVPISITIPSADLVANFKFQFLVTAGNLNGDLYPVGVDEIVIQTPNPLSASATATEVKCNGGNTGSATASPCGGTSPYTYSWSNAKTTATISGLSQGTYSVTVRDSCGNSATASVVITQPAGISMVKASTVDNGSCNGTAQVTVSGGTSPYTYLWSPNNQTTSSISGQCFGTYCCTVTDHNGCIDSACIVVSLFTGINATSNSSSIIVYPNPNNGNFTILMNDEFSVKIVEIYNVLGELVYSQPALQFSNSIDLSSKPSGVYFYRVLTESGGLISQGKLVIQK